jgi:hypothetical protein
MSVQKNARDYYLWGLLLFVAVVGVVAMPAEQYVGDPKVIHCEVISFLDTGRLGVPLDVAERFGGDPGQYFVENKSRDRWFCKYGVFNDVMTLPPLYLEELIRARELPYVPQSGEANIRVVVLNLYNVLLSLFVAFYLYSIAGRYTGSRWIMVLFVLASFYCTYWWYYLRAQNSEIYQTLFMLGFFYYFTGFFHDQDRDAKADRRHLLGAGIFLGVLMLVKTVFVIGMPVCGLTLLYYCQSQKNGSKWMAECRGLLRHALWLALPLAVAFSILLFANWYKFGSPLETGYSPWGERHLPLMSGPFFTNLGYLFFGIQGNVFIHYPLLLFALFGFYPFFRRWPVDAIFVLMLAACIFAIDAKLLNWLGWYGYGPRYVLTVLPLLSLPFLLVTEFVLAHFRQWWGGACAAAIAGCLLFSLWLQLNVNAVRFFAYFDLQNAAAVSKNPGVIAYLDYHPFGLVYHDMLAYQNKDAPWVLADGFLAGANEKDRAAFNKSLEPVARTNYYWWSSDSP